MCGDRTTWLGSDRGRRDGQLAAENFGPEDVPQMLVMLGNAAYATSVPNMQRARPAPSTLRNPEAGGLFRLCVMRNPHRTVLSGVNLLVGPLRATVWWGKGFGADKTFILSP